MDASPHLQPSHRVPAIRVVVVVVIRHTTPGKRAPAYPPRVYYATPSPSHALPQRHPSPSLTTPLVRTQLPATPPALARVRRPPYAAARAHWARHPEQKCSQPHGGPDLRRRDGHPQLHSLARPQRLLLPVSAPCEAARPSGPIIPLCVHGPHPTALCASSRPGEVVLVLPACPPVLPIPLSVISHSIVAAGDGLCAKSKRRCTSSVCVVVEGGKSKGFYSLCPLAHHPGPAALGHRQGSLAPSIYPTPAEQRTAP